MGEFLDLGVANSHEECAALCFNLGNCDYFVYARDGYYCLEAEGGEDDCWMVALPDFDFYKLYQDDWSNQGPHPPVEIDDSLGYWQIAENKQCESSSGYQLQQYNTSVSDCYELCRTYDGCEFFMRDPNDGECRGTNGPCDAPYTNSNFYNLYQMGSD